MAFVVSSIRCYCNNINIFKCNLNKTKMENVSKEISSLLKTYENLSEKLKQCFLDFSNLDFNTLWMCINCIQQLNDEKPRKISSQYDFHAYHNDAGERYITMGHIMMLEGVDGEVEISTTNKNLVKNAIDEFNLYYTFAIMCINSYNSFYDPEPVKDI